MSLPAPPASVSSPSSVASSFGPALPTSVVASGTTIVRSGGTPVCRPETAAFSMSAPISSFSPGRPSLATPSSVTVTRGVAVAAV